MAKLSGKVAELARDAALADRAKMLAQRWTRSPNSITNLVGQFVLTGLAGNTSYMFRQGLDADYLAHYIREEMAEDVQNVLHNGIAEALDEFMEQVRS